MKQFFTNVKGLDLIKPNSNCKLYVVQEYDNSTAIIMNANEEKSKLQDASYSSYNVDINSMFDFYDTLITSRAKYYLSTNKAYLIKDNEDSSCIIPIDLKDSLYIHKRIFIRDFNKTVITLTGAYIRNENDFKSLDIKDIINTFYLEPSGISMNEFNQSIDNIKSQEAFKDKVNNYKLDLEAFDIYFNHPVSKSIKLYNYLKQNILL